MAAAFAVAFQTAISGSASAQSALTDASEDAASTPSVAAGVAPPRLFEQRVLFRPEFLERLLSSARTASRPSIEVEIETPEMARAYAFAGKYGIDVDLARKIVESAIEEGVDPDLAFRLVNVESRFQPRARGPMGALGLTQLMPSTARTLDRSLRTEADILEPRNNLRLGFRYLRSMIDRYGDVRLGLLAYNRGSVAVDRALRDGRDPENGYSQRVLGSGGEQYRGEETIGAEAE